MSEECTHDCSNCSAACSSRDAAPQHDAPNPNSSVKKVIGVVSGKGGVGKSMTSALLACAMARRGYHCGILDADITGPSIPKLFGIHGRAMADDKGCWPIQSRMGIDHLFVDESHNFKNLMFNTRHARVSGLGNPEGSMKAMNMLFAIRTIQERTGRDLGGHFLVRYDHLQQPDRTLSPFQVSPSEGNGAAGDYLF